MSAPTGTDTVINSTYKKPTWDCWWFPVSRQGGDKNVYVNGGALAKYDAVFQSQSQAYELKNNAANYNPMNRWMGHCDKAAVAVCLLAPPRKAVTFQGVTFSVRDIQGLLVKVSHSLPYHFDYIGQRYPDGGINDPTPQETYYGLKQWSQRLLPIIVDVSPGPEVWNWAYDFVQFDFNTQTMHISSTGFQKENRSIRFDWQRNRWIGPAPDFLWMPVADADLVKRDSWPVEQRQIVTPFLNPHVSPRNVYDIYILSI